MRCLESSAVSSWPFTLAQEFSHAHSTICNIHQTTCRAGQSVRTQLIHQAWLNADLLTRTAVIADGARAEGESTKSPERQECRGWRSQFSPVVTQYRPDCNTSSVCFQPTNINILSRRKLGFSYSSKCIYCEIPTYRLMITKDQESWSLLQMLNLCPWAI